MLATSELRGMKGGSDGGHLPQAALAQLLPVPRWAGGGADDVVNVVGAGVEGLWLSVELQGRWVRCS